MGQLAATKAQQLVEEQQPLILQQLPTVPSAEPSASLQQQQSADNAQLSMGKTEEGILIHRDVELVVWRQEDLVIKDEFLGRGNFGQVRNGKLYVRGSGCVPRALPDNFDSVR